MSDKRYDGKRLFPSSDIRHLSSGTAMTIMYHEGNRRLQDAFDSRRISDRLEEKLTRTAFTDDDKAYIEAAIFFFIATADAEGRPDCSFQGRHARLRARHRALAARVPGLRRQRHVQ